jgi:cysteine-rich repeat protein
VFALLLCVASSASGQDRGPPRSKLDVTLRARLDAGRGFERMPISVVLRRSDLPARGAAAARRAAIRSRQQQVIDRLPTGSFDLRRRFENLAGFSLWAGADAIDALVRHPDVERVSIDGEVFASLNQGRLLTGASQAVANGYFGAGLTVAVLDTGIDTDHPDLSDDLLTERCYCEGSPSPASGCCPAGTDTQTGAGSAEDDDGHGTAIGGIITSSGAVAPPGIARDAGIVAIKVLDANGMGNFADVAAALDWLLTHHATFGVTAVNLSFGDHAEYPDPAASPCAGSLTAIAIEDLAAAGVAVFAASGNDAHTDGISFPACVAEAISVGGVYDGALGNVSWCGTTCDTTLCTDIGTAADDFVCHTNSDEILDLLAPDWRTLTSEIGGTANNFGGTSAATPYAAALAVLLRERDPGLTPETLRSLMTSNGPWVHNDANGLDHRRTDIATFFGICGNGSLELGEDCDDGNLADGDCCSSSCGFEAQGAPCSDDSACTDGDVCDGVGDCVVGPILACDDDEFCNGAESCDPVTGCMAGVPPALDDGVVCTIDVCDEQLDAVIHTPDPLACDDGAFCNGPELCDPVLDCVAGVPPALDDGVVCTFDACDEQLDAVIHTPDPLACDDGAFCTGAELCDPVLDCLAGVPPTLDDGVACTIDACDELLDLVVHDPDPFACDDADPCTAEACDAQTGCSHEPIPQCGVPVPIGGAPGLWLITLLLLTAGIWRLGASRHGAGLACSRRSSE